MLAVMMYDLTEHMEDNHSVDFVSVYMSQKRSKVLLFVLKMTQKNSS